MGLKYVMSASMQTVIFIFQIAVQVLNALVAFFKPDNTQPPE